MRERERNKNSFELASEREANEYEFQAKQKIN